MQYRKFGKLNWQVSALSLGITALSSPEEDKAVQIIRFSIDSGINFLDIGWPLAIKNNEQLSVILDKALGDGYRQKIKIAATVPPAIINTPSDFDRALEDLLKWLHADSIDFLLLGGLNRFTWPQFQGLDILRRLEKALGEKKIGRPGFFFHDQYQFLRAIIEAYDNWALCQFHYSFMDIDHHPGYGGLKYAADKGLGVIAAKPLLGGRLLKNIPERVAAIWSAAVPKRPPFEWALHWVWNHPEVSTIVCDMNSIDQVKENAALADTALPDSFSVPEELVISRVRDAYQALKPIPCTACRGCMPSQEPCPQDVDAPRIFEIYNDVAMYGDTAIAREIYRTERHNLDNCNDCGICASKCGMKIPIPEWLKKAQKLLAGND
jgi:predicted aldo/keto reductase-like oxidoreductase